MTHDTLPAYGLWGLVIINTAVFVIFAFSFTKPKTSRDWRRPAFMNMSGTRNMSASS